VAEVDLVIGGHHYSLSCADGEEAALQRLAAIVDQSAASARAMTGGLTETRQLLFAAILLADQLETAQSKAVAPVVAPASTPVDNSAELNAAAAQIDAMAARIAQATQRLAAIAR
jgi:cell division protein ZapA